MSSDQAVRVMVVSAIAGIGATLLVALVAPKQDTVFDAAEVDLLISQVAFAMVAGLGVQYYALRKWG